MADCGTGGSTRAAAWVVRLLLSRSKWALRLLRGRRELSKSPNWPVTREFSAGIVSKLRRPSVEVPCTIRLEHPGHRWAQGRVALLVGSEKHGVTREDMEHCHWLLRIATEDAQPSMNLGQAAAVCLWELTRVASAPVMETEARAASGELERLGALMLEVGAIHIPRRRQLRRRRCAGCCGGFM